MKGLRDRLLHFSRPFDAGRVRRLLATRASRRLPRDRRRGADAVVPCGIERRS